MRKTLTLGLIALLILAATGCYSVFTGGTGGQVVDADSTTTPKAGVPFVDVYAYTDEKDCNSDLASWSEGTVFTPHAEYYGHTTTDATGRFSLSKLIWKSYLPEFGKDADYTPVYLLFYHADYGLTKGSTVIVSDSTTNNMYIELKKIRKTTLLNINLHDVSIGTVTVPIVVTVTVPQTTQTQTSAAPKVYEQVITGAGTIAISYPRWQSAADKTNGVETEPVVTIDYKQSADEITWQGCYNDETAVGGFAFRADSTGKTTVTKTVRNSTFNVTLYGKRTRLTMPVISGQYYDTGDSGDDGIIIRLLMKDSSGNYTIYCGETTTFNQPISTGLMQDHGLFTGLGENFTWTDTDYTEKYAEADVGFFIGTTGPLTSSVGTVRSDTASYMVMLND